MSTNRVTDEVLDAIAHIEMHRQDSERESGLAAACSEALRKLHELLEAERAVLQQQGAGHSANLDAVTNEINKVKRLAGMSSQERPKQKQEHRGGQQPQPGSARKGTPNAPRNKGRRTMGRRGER